MNMSENLNTEATGTVQEPAETSAPAEKLPLWKRFPWLIIPAVITLGLMIYFFVTIAWMSLTKFSILKGIWGSDYIGLRNHQFVSGMFATGAWNTLVGKLLVLAISAGLSALMCLWYSCMKKPKAILTAACLWLIPTALPTIFTMTSATGFIYSLGWKYSAPLLAAGTVLQTTGIFCFAAGLFAWMNHLKTGQTGKASFLGLLVAVLAWLLSILSTSSIYEAGMAANNTPLLDHLIFNNILRANYSQESALTVEKVLVQFALGLIPMVFLIRMSGKEILPVPRSSRNHLWLLAAAAAGILLAYFIKVPLKRPSTGLGLILRTVIISLSAAALGGLIIWSFMDLFRRSSARWYGILALILSAALSGTTYLPFYLGLARLDAYDSLLPSVLVAVLDWRLILLAIILAFVLRSHSVSRPGMLVFALCLLAGAFAWGSVNNFLISTAPRSMPLGYYYFRLATSTKTPADTLLKVKLFLLVPPLALGAFAAFFTRRACSGDAPEATAK